MNRQCYTCSRISSGSCNHCLINGGRYNNYKEKKTLSYVDFIPLFIDSSPGSTPEEKYDFACGLAKKHIETIESERRKLIEADMLEKEQKEKLRISEVEEYIEKYNACAAEIFPSPAQASGRDDFKLPLEAEKERNKKELRDLFLKTAEQRSAEGR